MPITKTKIINVSDPKRGDVVVFRYPGNEKINFIKRVIGLPGDQIRYEDKNLYVNNIKYEKTLKNTHMYENEFLRPELDIFLESNSKR